MSKTKMTADDVINAINYVAYNTGKKNGLKNMEALLPMLYDHPRVPVIHVAGTNGKGSTCAMLESILRCAGYRTGLYTSPFLQVYNERIRLNGVPVSDEQLVRYGQPLVEACEALRSRKVYVTTFEAGTALAFSAFEGEKVDVAIVEVGLGGRLDPTNVVKPAVCAITALGMDHMDFLGDTLEAIAGEKAGIIKDGTPVICHPAQENVAAVFAGAAREKHAPITQLQEEQITDAVCTARGSRATFRLGQTWKDVEIPLPGRHQLTNALTVLGLVEELRRQGWQIPDGAVREGIRRAVWPARLEWCGNVLIDGAHNPQGVEALARYVQEHLMGEKRVLLSGILMDKIQPGLIARIASLAEAAVTVTPGNPRALPVEDYSAALKAEGVEAYPAQSLKEGLARARELAGEDGVIIAAGSLYFAGELRTELGLSWN